MSVREDLWASVRAYLALAVLLGGIYSLFVLAVAQLFFPATANGSLIAQNGQVVGSRLIGQPFTGPEWFWGRPSATVSSTDSSRAQPYNADNSGGTNYGPTNPALIREIQANMKPYRGIAASLIPPDLVESSASGLDPDISPQAALLQVPRVAAARHVSAASLRALIAAHTQPPWLDMFGAPRVSVLELNLALANGSS
jgi:K+-transporting ATPase ATPase C chain